LPGQFGGGGGAAGAKLNPHFDFRLHSGLMNFLDQTKDAGGRDGDKPGGDLDRIEAELAAMLKILFDRVAALREDVLDEPAGGNAHLVLVTQLDQLADRAARKDRERPTGEFQRVDETARGFKDIAEIPLAHWRVVRPADFGQAD